MNHLEGKTQVQYVLNAVSYATCCLNALILATGWPAKTQTRSYITDISNDKCCCADCNL